eukprot:Skav227897  [mRNA]  locus=scaffold4087:125603:133364:- [translate_table: standard]
MNTMSESWLSSQQRAFMLNGLALELPSARLRNRYPEALARDQAQDVSDIALRTLKQGPRVPKTMVFKEAQDVATSEESER